MNEIKALFFDIDDTLYSTSEFARTARLNCVQAMIDVGLDMTLEECYRELKETIEEFGSNFGQHINKMLLRISPELYANTNPAIIIAAGVVAYHKTKAKGLIPYDDVIKILKILQNKNIIIGIITEGLQIKQGEKLIRLNLLQYIHPKAIFITDQIGIGKSNPKLYFRASKQLGLLPQNCMQIGDNPLKDIDPANEAGMQTCLCKRGNKYLNVAGKTEPNYIINNMWDLLDILRDQGLQL